jgi:hypothetical protein
MEAAQMFAELLKALFELTLDKRVEAVMAELSKPDWSPDEHARLTLLLVHALRLLNRRSEVVDYVNREVAGHCSDQLKARILEFRALVEIDRADDVAAMFTLAEMERWGIAPVQLPTICWIKAKAFSLQGDDAALGWFRQAYDAFVVVGNTYDAETQAVGAALFLTDTGRSAGDWLALLPASHPYRMAMEAEVALSASDVAGVQRLTDAVLSDPKSDSHAKARAVFVQAMAARKFSNDRAAYLAEQALSLATSHMEGFEPRLVERIRQFKYLCEEGVACGD